MAEKERSESEKQTGEFGEANDSTSDRVIVKPDQLRSVVWRFFGFWSVGGKIVDKTKAVCKLCNMEMAYHSTTTNLKLHLEKVHHTEYKQVCDEAEGPLSKQPKLTAYYSSTAALPAVKQEAITKKLTAFICKVMLPKNLNEGHGVDHRRVDFPRH